MRGLVRNVIHLHWTLLVWSWWPVTNTEAADNQLRDQQWAVVSSGHGTPVHQCCHRQWASHSLPHNHQPSQWSHTELQLISVGAQYTFKILRYKNQIIKWQVINEFKFYWSLHSDMYHDMIWSWFVSSCMRWNSQILTKCNNHKKADLIYNIKQ